MKIHIKTLTNKSTTLTVSEDDTITKVKSLYQDKTGIPPKQQKLLFEGFKLEEGKTVDDYSVRHLMGDKTNTKSDTHFDLNELIKVKDGLDDSKTVKECHLEENSILLVILRMGSK